MVRNAGVPLRKQDRGSFSRPSRLNFGGVYRCDAQAHRSTGLRLILDGYDAASGHFRADGAIRLLDSRDADAASWSFAKLMGHWKTKHAHAAYVPCEMRKLPVQNYRYANEILIGEGAQFRLFLKAVAEGRIYYDPGINMQDASTAKPKMKLRSQIRVSSKDIGSLYTTSRIAAVCS